MNLQQNAFLVTLATVGALAIIVLAPVVHAANAGSWPAFWVMVGFLALMLVGVVGIVVWSMRRKDE